MLLIKIFTATATKRSRGSHTSINVAGKLRIVIGMQHSQRSKQSIIINVNNKIETADALFVNTIIVAGGIATDE